MDTDERTETTERMADFYDGASVVEKLAAWADVVANHRAMLEQLTKLRGAYEHLLRLYEAGKLQGGGAFSAEDVARIERIRHLIQSMPQPAEVLPAAHEIRVLVDACMRGPIGSATKAPDLPGDPDPPTVDP
jgi:hypothetical protein